MAREPPELANWDDRLLRTIAVTEPRVWVETVLSCVDPTRLFRESYDSDSESIVFFETRTYGQIREAILRELQRRGESANPRRNADQITLRGLRALRDEGALSEESEGYRLTAGWGVAESIRSLARHFAMLSRHDPHAVKIEVKSRRKRGRMRPNQWYTFSLRITLKSRDKEMGLVAWEVPVRIKPLTKGSRLLSNPASTPSA